MVDETVEVASVDSAFDAQQEWPAVVACFAREAEIAVSNTGDTGFERSREDAAHDYCLEYAARQLSGETARAPSRSLPIEFKEAAAGA